MSRPTVGAESLQRQNLEPQGRSCAPRSPPFQGPVALDKISDKRASSADKRVAGGMSLPATTGRRSSRSSYLVVITARSGSEVFSRLLRRTKLEVMCPDRP